LRAPAQRNDQGRHGRIEAVEVNVSAAGFP
jgi:hypothetical protein